VQPNTSDTHFSEQTLQQIAADAQRALLRARYCLERSRINRFHCIDNQPETDNHYGRQLWYFEGSAVDELDRRCRIFGAVEYSIQYGLHELVEDGVFEAAEQRDRFRNAYAGHRPAISWRNPANRLLIGILLAMTAATVATVTFGLLTR
jgi:hypothetical protein